MTRYVVTGGAGFIGSALVRRLLEQPGAEVAVVDSLLTGNKENLEQVRSRIDFHQVDAGDYNAVLPVVREADAVFHLAAIPSVPRSILDPVPSHEANIDATFHLLRACADGGARRVVYAASSSAYGDTETLPKVETMAPLPKSPYAVQKLLGEYYCSVFHSCFGLETVSLRFFNVYGPRQDPTSQYSGVISVFMKCVLEGRSPSITGDGEQSRDFTFVEDVVSLLVKASRASGVCGRVYNAGNGNRYTLNEVWALLQKIEDVSLSPTYIAARAGDVLHSQADVAAARRDLAHAPEFTLEEGLRRTLAWYRDSLSATTAGSGETPSRLAAQRR